MARDQRAVHADNADRVMVQCLRQYFLLAVRHLAASLEVDNNIVPGEVAIRQHDHIEEGPVRGAAALVANIPGEERLPILCADGGEYVKSVARYGQVVQPSRKDSSECFLVEFAQLEIVAEV